MNIITCLFILLEEVSMVHPFGLALHGEWTSGEMRNQHGRDAHVIINHLALGKAGRGIEDLLQVRELQLAALDFDDGWCRHRE